MKMSTMMANRPKDAMGRVGPEDKGVYLTPPAGAELEGKSGDAQISWVRASDGRIEITAVNGAKLSEDETAEPTQEEGEPESAMDNMGEEEG